MRFSVALLAALVSLAPVAQEPADAKPADRLKSRARQLADHGGKAAEDAVLAALGWLARHQDDDGGWSVGPFAKIAADPCAGPGTGGHDPGLTSLVLLAFLGAGYSPASKDELPDPADPKKKWKPGEIVRKGLDRLHTHQRKDGAILGESKPIYDHAIATAALCEAASMTGAPRDRNAAQKAVDYLLDARNPGAAWRYTHRSGDNDTSVSGWGAFALHAATQAGLWKVAAPVGADVVGWMDSVTQAPGARAGYNGAGSGKVFVPGQNETFVHHETMTAISGLARRFLKSEDPEITDDIKVILLRDPPDPGANAIDSYYWFWGSLALHRLDGPAGKSWLRWSGFLQKAILPLQSVKGCSAGSWDPNGDRWGFEGSRAGVTALNALSLLTPAR